MRLSWLASAALLALAPAMLPAQTPPAAPGPELRIEGLARQGALVRGVAPAGTRLLTLDGIAVPVASDGSFVLGIDRDAPASITLVAQGQGTSAWERRMTLPVLPRAWRIERLDRLAKVPVPDADFLRRRPGELAQIKAARAQDTGAAGWRQTMTWPVRGRISGLFGAQRIYRGEPGSYHSGVDVARPTGTPVTAPADGVVILVADEPFTLEGRLLMIDHGHGLNSAFLHLSRIDVRPGQRVRQGEPVGLVGATGRATGPHLHWSLRWQEARLDPLLAAGPMTN